VKSDSHHFPKRRNVRLKHYDYSADGHYFVTICAHQRKPMIDKYKEIVESVLRELPGRFSGLRIDYHVLMASHVHVIFVLQGVEVPLWQVVRTFKALVSKRIGVRNFWQRGYYEHVVRNEKALLRIREYIQNNPVAEKIEFERFYSERAR
jgi:putative transposase